MRDGCRHLFTSHPLNSKGVSNVYKSSSGLDTRNATHYFFFGDTLELSSTFGFGWQFIQRKIGIHVTLSSEKWNFMLIKQVL